MIIVHTETGIEKRKTSTKYYFFLNKEFVSNKFYLVKEDYWFET